MTENFKTILVFFVILQILVLAVGGLILNKINNNQTSTNLIQDKKEELLAWDKKLTSLSKDLNLTIENEKLRYETLKQNLNDINAQKDASSTSVKIPVIPPKPVIKPAPTPTPVTRAS